MILNWLKRSASKNLLGLDFGSDTIKILEISATENNKKIENYAIAPLPTGAIVASEIKNSQAVIHTLKEIAEDTNFTTKKVAIAIPRASVVIKNTTIDSRLSEDEIESRAWIEANNQFPELIGGIYLDYQLLGSVSGRADKTEMMLIACRKEQIDPYLSVLSESNFEAKVIDVNTYALERSFFLLKKHNVALEPKALLNFDLTLSTLIVTQKEDLIYSRDHSYDAHRFMTQVTKYLKEDTQFAMSLESQANPTIPSAYQDILKENLISHLRHIMHFFHASRPNVNLQTLVLSGECVQIPHLTEFIKQELNINTEIANPLAKMSLASSLDEINLQKQAPSLMLACGLALNQLGQ